METNYVLNELEIRILGCLVEKEMTTPEYYPLTLNSLTTACNQKSNRNPVVLFEETDVVRGLDSLREKELVNQVFKADSRVPKYRHSLGEKLNLIRREQALLCELMLRGPQTPGEIRTHVERMCALKDLDEVEEVLAGLMGRGNPLVIRLPRQPGQKEQRYMHLLSGVPDISEIVPQAPAEPAALRVRAENEKITRLEEEINLLRTEIEELKKAFSEFKSQF